MTGQPVSDRAAYREQRPKLDSGNHLFQCSNCGHYAGDPRENNFRAKCAGCERFVKYYRIIW